jgi:hypothetical protein
MDPWLKYGVVFLFGVVVGAVPMKWRCDGQVSEIKLTAANKLLDANEELRKKDAKLAAADLEILSRVSHEKIQDQIQRADVDAGRKRLLVYAKCPGLPETVTAPGVDNGGGQRAELDSAARPAYYALRDGIRDELAKLQACRQRLSELSY